MVEANKIKYDPDFIKAGIDELEVRIAEDKDTVKEVYRCNSGYLEDS